MTHDGTRLGSSIEEFFEALGEREELEKLTAEKLGRSPAQQAYRAGIDALLNARKAAGGELTDDQETEWMERLDVLWHAMSADEQASVETVHEKGPTKLAELDVVRLTVAPLPAGALGTIVHVHNGGEAFEVEFVADDGNTIGVLTLRPSQIESTGRKAGA